MATQMTTLSFCVKKDASHYFVVRVGKFLYTAMAINEVFCESTGIAVKKNTSETKKINKTFTLKR